GGGRCDDGDRRSPDDRAARRGDAREVRAEDGTHRHRARGAEELRAGRGSARVDHGGRVPVARGADPSRDRVRRAVPGLRAREGERAGRRTRRRRGPRDARLLMPRPFVLPDLGEGLTEAEIVKVLVNEGDVIREDAPLIEVETDKAQVEIPSPMSGRVEKIHVEPHQTVKVGQVLVTFGEAVSVATKPIGKQAADTLDPTRTLAPEPRTTVQGTRARQAPAAESPHAPVRSFEPVEARAAVDVGAARRSGPVPATPSTRRLSRELGVDLHTVRGTGPGGRVTDDDVRAAAAGGAAPSAQARDVPRTDGAARAAAATPAPAKPLATHVTEPPLPNFEQWGPIERQPLSHLRRT